MTGYVVCVSNESYAASLELWKIYPLLKPLANDPSSLLRVVDEDGEDYLYPKEWFRPIEVPRPIQTLLKAHVRPNPSLQRTGSARR